MAKKEFKSESIRNIQNVYNILYIVNTTSFFFFPINYMTCITLD